MNQTAIPAVPAAAPLGARPRPESGRRVAVLHLIHSVCHGGIESALINWVRYFDRERFDVHVACFANDRKRELPFLAAAERAGIHVYKVPWAPYKPFLKCARGVADLIREHRIDILHTHAYYGDAVGALVRRMTAVKTVATVYVWGKYEFKRRLLQKMDEISLRYVDKVTAHCEMTRRGTIARGFPADKVPVLFPGFPDEHTPPSAAQRREMRRAAGLDDDHVLLVNVARINREKAHDQLLQSFRLVHDRFPRTRLWISGVGDAELQRELTALRDQLGLQGVADFIGFRPDLWPLLDIADFMVHPSHVEGVPIAICYGMAAGLPIVASDVGGLWEVISSGRTGRLVPENDVQGFADTLSQLIDDREQARELGAAARRFMQSEYSIQAAVQRVADTYHEVLGR